MDTQAEDTVSPKSEKSDMPMHAYVVMLHLVSQGYTDFTELKELLCLDYYGNYYTTLLDRIFKTIETLKEEWGESIPPITALVFKTDGTATEWVCEILTGSTETQPTAKQIAELTTSVAAYDRWDEVLKALRP